MSRPIKPRGKVEDDPYNESPLKTILDIPKDMVTAKAPRPRMMIIKDGGQDGAT